MSTASDRQPGGLPRRDAVATLGLAAAAIAAPGLAAAGRGSRLDLASSEGRRMAYLLMRGSLDDRVVIGSVSGQYYGVVEAELKPLFGVVSATFARYRQLASGDVEVVSLERAYFTDPRTGETMTAYGNPYTGETLTVPLGGLPPSRFTITRDLDLKLARAVPGLTFEHRVGPLDMRGDDVWITEVTRTASVPASGAKPFRYSESTTLHARRADLLAPGARRVRCETSFNNVVSWRPWLKMGDRPGHMMAVGVGRYGAAMTELPAAWLAATRRDQPALIADPAAALAPVWDAK